MSEWATHWDYYDFSWSVDFAGVLEIDRLRTAWKTFCRLSEPTKGAPAGELECEGYGNDRRRLRRYPGVQAKKGGDLLVLEFGNVPLSGEDVTNAVSFVAFGQGVGLKFLRVLVVRIVF